MLLQNALAFLKKEKWLLQNALAFLKKEKWLCKMRWHFSKLKNDFAKCADVSQR